MQHEFRKLRSANRVAVRLRSVGDWYEADPGSALFGVAERAVEKQWGRPPLYVREGGTMPVRGVGSAVVVPWQPCCGNLGHMC